MDFNINEIKRNAFCDVEAKALEMNGTIFGGYVRDTIISDHYAIEYNAHLRANKERFMKKKFWDMSNHPDTAARTLNPEDIDIYFADSADAKRFVDSLEELCQREHIDMTVDNQCNDDPSNRNNVYGKMLNVQKVSLIITAGRIPFVCKGFLIFIEIDVVTPRYDTLQQPPFRNLDFLCNGFIKTKHGVMYSRCTGTYLDLLSEIKKSTEVAKIMQDMLEFKTVFCRFSKRSDSAGLAKRSYANNCYALKRIDKLLQKETFPWTICNLPFEITKACKENIGNTCCICTEEFTNKDVLAISALKTDEFDMKSCCMHKGCFMSYLNHQQREAVCNGIDLDDFTFKCPFRNPIDFTKCVM